jgi:Domain of unknown function (DUF4386)
MKSIVEMSPRTRARIAGAVYLLFFLTAVLGAVVAPSTGPGAPSGDAAVAANGIVGHEALYELGVALGLISTVFYVGLAGLFYQMFRPVSRNLSLLVVLFSLVGSVITAVGSLLQLAPLDILSGGSYLSVFSHQQLHSLSLLFLNLSLDAGHVALVFFGVFQLFLGYLIYKSTFLPRLIGVLIAVAGVGWLTFLSPPLANYLLTILEAVGFAAEASLMLWLLVMGVNVQRWNEKAGAAS